MQLNEMLVLLDDCQARMLEPHEKFKAAFVGLAIIGPGAYSACYDEDKIIEILMTADGMSQSDAEEFFDINIAGAWYGPNSPVFIERFDPQGEKS